VDGYKAWKLYMAVKLHFTTNKYNVFNNRGHVKGARDSFVTRNDRYIFEKLARRFSSEQEIIQYYVANFAYGNDSVVYSDGEGLDNLTTWQKRKQSVSRIFENDLQVIHLHLEKQGLGITDLFSGGSPELLKLHLGGFVTIETMVILNSITGYLANWAHLNLLWDVECRRIDKCKGFVKFDIEKLTETYVKFEQEILELQS